MKTEPSGRRRRFTGSILSTGRKPLLRVLVTEKLSSGHQHDAKITVLSSRCEGRHAQPDASSTAELTGDLRAAAVKRQDALHDSQAQPSATRRLGARWVDAKEAIEHSGQRLGGNAGSGANMCEGRNKASGGVMTTRRVPRSKLQGQFGS